MRVHRKRRLACARKPTAAPLPAGLVWLADVPVKPVRWLWKGWVPRGVVTIVEGPPGAGKSSVLRELVACVTTGRPMPGESESRDPAGVIWLSSEEDMGVQLRPVVDAAGGDSASVAVLGEDGWLPRMIDSLAEVIDAHGVALVVVDQFKDHLESLGDESETRVRAAMLPWVRLAQRTGAAVVGVRHWRKSGGSAADRGAGSVAYNALVRQSIAVGPHDGCRVAAVEKPYRTPKPTSLAFDIDDGGRVQWRGEVALTANDVAAYQPSASSGAPRASPARDDAVDRLRAELANGPRKATDVRAAMAAGFADRTIDRAAIAVGVVRVGKGKATTWSLPRVE